MRFVQCTTAGASNQPPELELAASHQSISVTRTESGLKQHEWQLVARRTAIPLLNVSSRQLLQLLTCN
jgi:N-glycosylase/DNA lyase